MKRFAYVLSAVLLALLAQPAIGESADTHAPPPDVDFRITPLEQAKKINQLAKVREDADVTLTVMNGWEDGKGDRNHLLVDESLVTAEYLRKTLANQSVDGVSWSHRTMRPYGACDTDTECKQKVEEMCDNAGHSGVKAFTVKITTHADGSKTCSGDCEENGAIAFVTCNPSR